MKILITIPTYKRERKLERCLNSIYANGYKNFDILVVADNNDFNTNLFVISYAFAKNVKIKCMVNNTHKFVIGVWNYAFKQFHSDYDGFMWLVDDVELFPDCIEKAVNCMRDNFPDLDGIIGLTQKCPKRPDFTYKNSYGQILIGKKFVERYKEVDYRVCCPFYTHFHQDFELYTYAKSLNKFITCGEAILFHYHPGTCIEERDETHLIVRGDIIRKDNETFKKRQEKGLVWGQSWEEK